MRYLVTGGGGFLGLEIVRRLRARGDEVVSYSRTKHPAVEQSGAQSVQGNLTDELKLSEAMRGCDGVFHVAAKAGIWGPKADYAHTNIAGTRSVVPPAARWGHSLPASGMRPHAGRSGCRRTRARSTVTGTRATRQAPATAHRTVHVRFFSFL